MKCKIFIFIFILINIFTINVEAKDTSKSSIVMDMNSGRILYENNIAEKRLIASTTKIMTAIITIENAELSEKVKIGKEILTMYGTNIYLDVNEIITVEDLLYGLILRSGNDAAIALAYYIGETEEKFVQMMNDKAKELGMNNTTFENPHGLDDYTKNFSTAYDMALLSSYANKNKIYNKISKTKKYKTSNNKKTYLWYNRNKLLQQYEYCTGGKNGYTPDAGRTLVTTSSKDNLNLTVVTLNDPNEYDTHQYLYNLIYDKYKIYTLIDKDSFYIPKTKKAKYIVKRDFLYPLTKEEKNKIKTEIILSNKESNDDKVGYITIKIEDKVIGKLDLYKNIEKKEDISIFSKVKNYLFDILKKLILGRQNNLKPGPLVPSPLEIYNSVSLTL